MQSFAAAVALAVLAVGTCSPTTREICRTPQLDVPPPGNWPALPTLQQVQAYLVNGDRLQNTEVRLPSPLSHGFAVHSIVYSQFYE
jgi:hypothetical protein